jgi:hypothetical protein
MSHLSLLFTSATQGTSNAFGMNRQTEHEVHAAPDTAESAWTGTGDESNDYRLPSGIASLEHWLDLNA